MDRTSKLPIKTGTTFRGIRGVPMRAAKAGNGALMIRIAATAVFCALALGVQGCSLFHHGESPQQKFMDALNRGNGAQASQLWLTMSAKDRSNFSHNIGFQRQVNKDEIARAMLKHQREAAAKDGEESDDATSNQAYGEDGSQQVEIPGLDADSSSGNLSNLQLLNTLRQTASPTTIGPQ
jgi:hypothetical protein